MQSYDMNEWDSFVRKKYLLRRNVCVIYGLTELAVSPYFSIKIFFFFWSDVMFFSEKCFHLL